MAKQIDSIQIKDGEINYFTLSENSSLTNLTVSNNLKVDRINFTDNDFEMGTGDQPSLTIGTYSAPDDLDGFFIGSKEPLFITNSYNCISMSEDTMSIIGASTLKIDSNEVIINGINFEERIDDLQNSLDTHEDSISSVKLTLSNHTNNKSNPHSVTKSQVGLGSVANYGQTSSPTSGSNLYFTAGGAYNLKTSIDSKPNLSGTNTWTGQQTFSATNTYTKDILPLSSFSYSLGSSSRYFNNAYINNLYLNGSITHSGKTYSLPDTGGTLQRELMFTVSSFGGTTTVSSSSASFILTGEVSIPNDYNGANGIVMIQTYNMRLPQTASPANYTFRFDTTFNGVPTIILQPVGNVPSDSTYNMNLVILTQFNNQFTVRKQLNEWINANVLVMGRV